MATPVSLPCASPQAGLAPDVVQLWFVRVLEPGRLGRASRLLSCAESARAARFRAEADRAGFTALHAAARVVLGAVTGGAPSRLVFRGEPGEKPALEGASRVHFSLSRTTGFGLVGVSAAPLGVDVEAVRCLPDADSIARRFFARAEADQLAAMPPDARRDAFFACWSRKEAFVKAIGLGLAWPLDRFEVDADPAHPALRSIDGRAEAAAGWSLWSGRLASAWAAAAVERTDVTFEAALLDDAAWT